MLDPNGMAEWDERAATAVALRSLGHALVGRQVPLETLREVQTFARRVLDDIQSSPPRSRMEEMGASARFAQILAGEWSAIAVGADLRDLFPESIVSGYANPLGIGLQLRREGEGVVGTATLGPAFEGAPGRAHGGVVAAIIDETMGAVLPLVGTLAYTGSLSIDFRAPTPLGAPVEFHAFLEAREGRKLRIACEARVGGEVLVSATGLFVTIDAPAFASNARATSEGGEDIQ